MIYSFPVPSAAEFVERVSAPPSAGSVHRWVLRDDNQREHHGVVSMREEPFYIELHWKPNGNSQEQLVGIYRLHLARLLEAEYVRKEREGDDDAIRLRFVHGERNVILIQVPGDNPGLPIGVVDTTL